MRRLAFLLIFGLGGAAILVALGVWQVQRLGWKQALVADIEARIAGAPVAIPDDPDPRADRDLPVTATGTMGTGNLRVLVSLKQVGAGYRVIVPFVLDDGRSILLDRGFLPAEAADPGPVPGPVTVTGNLSWPQERDRFTPAPDTSANIWFARDVPAMSAALGTEPLLLVARRTEPEDTAFTPMPVDTAGIPNDHLQYAITWFSLAVIWLAMSAYFLRRGRAT